MYELAELYHKAGMEEKCVATCDTIMLLFGLGKYVDKAMDLKLEYAPLNKYQMDLVENRDKYEAKLRAVEEEYGSRAGRVKAEPTVTEELPEEVVAEAETDVDVEVAVDESVVIKLHEDEQTEMLAQEMAKLAEEEAPTAIVEEDDMDATRALDDLRSLKEIKPTQRVLDAAAERAAEEAAETEREIERQRAAIRAAKEREEMEAEALRRAEEEREAARRAEEERRARRQAEIDRERAEAEAKAAAAAAAEVEELDLEDAEEASNEMNNLMIESETEEEGLAMALEALKKIHRELGSKNPVAKISSEKLNKKGILAVADKLRGKDLVIEQAAGLAPAVQNELDELMEQDDSGMIVVLIDTPENLEKLHAAHASLASKFQYIGADAADKTAPAAEIPSDKVIRLRPETEETYKEDEANAKTQESEPVEEADAESEDTYEEEAKEAYQNDREDVSDDDYDDENEMDPDEFAQYACKYAAEIDCSIVDKSLLALYERIEMMEEDGVRLTKKAAVDLIEEAADKAEKQSFGRKLMSLISPMYDKEGYLILREKDFFD